MFISCEYYLTLVSSHPLFYFPLLLPSPRPLHYSTVFSMYPYVLFLQRHVLWAPWDVWHYQWTNSHIYIYRPVIENTYNYKIIIIIIVVRICLKTKFVVYITRAFSFMLT
jgi:hypothetical protein